MESLVALAAEVQAFCRDQNWRFCFIGGFAVQHWGEPRLTRDVDLSLLSGFGDEEAYISTLLKKFESRIPDAASFAVTRRVLLLKSSTGIGIDVALAGLPFEERVIQRAIDVPYSADTTLKICSAEDLIVHKAFANRAIDWHDIESVLIRQEGKLNTPQILEELQPLVDLKEEPAILDRLKEMLK